MLLLFIKAIMNPYYLFDSSFINSKRLTRSDGNISVLLHGLTSASKTSLQGKQAKIAKFKG
uniref:Uncharacterized protein n=1 Tax=Hyaloperonospora arabidopsidis (strain Emoy2) TaxID=559515 RepID=M4BWP6_HYAAE